MLVVLLPVPTSLDVDNDLPAGGAPSVGDSTADPGAEPGPVDGAGLLRDVRMGNGGVADAMTGGGEQE